MCKQSAVYVHKVTMLHMPYLISGSIEIKTCLQGACGSSATKLGPAATVFMGVHDPICCFSWLLQSSSHCFNAGAQFGFASVVRCEIVVSEDVCT